MQEFTIDQFRDHVGHELGTSEWITVDQQSIDKFADATGDFQWIHIDPTRAAEGPFGTTIAHGFLTLALLPQMLGGLYRVTGLAMTINYGLNRVRFPAAVAAGSRVRTVAHLLRVDVVGDRSQSVVRCTIELEGSTKPACVAELVGLLLHAR
ncbi:MaoC family dehydratase [Microbacterium sp. A93]|uniref:MaoC family dehydratase n=1 Tax=Microbacterium sp. A93 TaxID=3450716 RepID=UPI003F6DED09